MANDKQEKDFLQRHSKTRYEFTAKTWTYPGKGTWHFVSLPIELSEEIRELFKMQEEGWGRLKVVAKTGKSQWETAIWFDTKHNAYLLPIKAAIRKKEKIELDQDVKILIWI